VYSILIIEDDPLCCNMMKVILQMEGFYVRSASNGRLGLALLYEERSDLILCDVMMMEMDGHSVLDALRHDRNVADIPFIFVSALSEHADIRRGMSEGADDYLPKPFTADELLSAVIGRIRRHLLITANRASTVFKEEQEVISTKVTKREREILLMVGNGITSKNIAERLGVTPKTVDSHRANMMIKLDAPNSASLARWAVIAELMEYDPD
jgi:DNA-binding NarL/FixJ family response regulator